MSILARFAPPSVTTTQQYDETIRRLQEGEWPPDGMEYHVCFLSDDGNVRVSEIWDSLEQFQAFGERLMPLLSELGIEPGDPELLEVYNTVRR